MKVILTQDVKGVGRAGEVVTVADGYGRNYLLPRKLAIQATGGSVKAVEHQQALVRRRIEREQQEASALAQRLEGQSVTIRARAGEGGRLFGSVTAGDVAEALRAQFGAEVDRRRIELEAPVKQLGSFPVTLRLAAGITASVNLVVEAEQAEGAPAQGSEG
ncbi:MAG: 50S ribosomal protein L9 [Limnochordaceae bacterium]|uniref:Large ribosomal subunit protein bL9 n=1 Tax=Carboxydichorda subterranea TaxID=3109565 RepID=A0ABZ1BWA3_9FIRM|nr:50S ribosomal protein L9 [Limnochorda sp. L945t]MBE3599604.1 50S ribosomal protein L9 [Limnochordaceae bacterium]WRP17080.1 50S ribosomal protein L9 [Limnochorda sp. L945t]